MDVFEKHAARYEEWFDAHRPVFRSEVDAIRQLLPTDGKGVEIGVGTGRFSAVLGIRCGVEPAASMRVRAEARGIDVVEGVAEELPFAAQTFDYALMATTICFLDDVQKAFDEAWRILKSGSAFVVAFIDRTSPLGEHYQRRTSASAFYRNAQFYSAREVAHHMRASGFDRLTYRQTLFGDPEEMVAADAVKEGYGEGAFVVVRGLKSVPR